MIEYGIIRLVYIFFFINSNILRTLKLCEKKLSIQNSNQDNENVHINITYSTIECWPVTNALCCTVGEKVFENISNISNYKIYSQSIQCTKISLKEKIWDLSVCSKIEEALTEQNFNTELGFCVQNTRSREAASIVTEFWVKQ